MRTLSLVLTLLVAGSAANPVVTLAAQPRHEAGSSEQVYVSRARALDSEGRHDLAASNWQQVLLLSPQQPEALAALARYYQQQGNAARAKEYLDRLNAVNPEHGALLPQTSFVDNQAILQQAVRLAEQHQYREAVDLYRKVLGDNPSSGDWAIAYYETEAALPSELPHAVQNLRKMVDAYPANPNYRLALAKVLTYSTSTRAEGLRMFEDFHASPQLMQDAQADWKTALLWDPALPAAQQSGAVYLQRYPDDQLAEALRTGQQQREHAAGEGVPQEAEGYNNLQQGNLSAALQDFTAMLDMRDQTARAHLGLGYVYMKQRDFSNAVLNFDQARKAGLHTAAVESAYRDARYWELMQQGTAAETSGEQSAAANAYHQAAELEPNRPEANQALAGLWMKAGQPDAAIPMFSQLVTRHPDSESAWLALVNAQLQAGQFEQILAQQSSISANVQKQLNQEPDYLVALASANFALGNNAAAQQVLAGLDTARFASSSDRATIQLKIADMMLRQDRAEQAVNLSREAVRQDRSNPDTWQTLIRAENQAGRSGSALQLIEYLPAQVKAQLDRDPGFLILAASIYQKQREFEEAALMLARAQEVGNQQLQTSIPLQLQLASLDRDMGRTSAAYNIYLQLTHQHPSRPEPWVGLLSTLHDARHDSDALAVVDQLPADMRLRLLDNIDYLQALASIYSALGENNRSMAYLRRAMQHYQAQGVTAPFGVNVQFAWMQLNAGDESGLAASLNKLSSTSSLSPAQKKQIEEIWVAWSIRRAENSLKDGSPDQAFQLLNAAQQVYPENANLRRELGNLYIRRGQPEDAYRLYEHFDWDGASEADFSGGIAAAAASDHWKQANIWLGVALNQYPQNRQLLTQAAMMEQDHGDIKKAEDYWLAVRKLDELNAATATVQTADGGITTASSPEARLAAMLTPTAGTQHTENAARLSADQTDDESNRDLILGGSSASAPEPSREMMTPQSNQIGAGNPQPALQNLPSSGSLVLSPASAHLNPPAPSVDEMASQMAQEAQPSGRLTFTPPADAANSFPASTDASDSSSSSSSQPAFGGNIAQAGDSTPATPQTLSLEAKLLPPSSSTLPAGMNPAIQLNPSSLQPRSDGLASLKAGLSPWMGGGTTVSSRTGESGFDQLTRVETTLEGSTVLGQSARLTLMMRPVLLETGAASSTPIYYYGTAGTAPSDSQYQSGVGGEVQLATSHVQASLGYTPSSFLVHNAIGSLNVAASHAVSFHFTRTPVQETLLSYAGLKDPATGEIWGGIVATGGGIQVSKGDAHSGFYSQIDYNNLTGRNVPQNSSFSGSMGGYWRAFQNEYGSLTTGLNMTGEHFRKNLQYFTFGQGGYFSPDVYMLVNVPLTWQAAPARNFNYAVSASLGSQTYQEGDVTAGSFLTTSNASSGSSANYSFDARGSYRITPNWYLEGFLSANNAYDYSQHVAGFSLKFMTDPHPASTNTPTGLFDTKAIRPLVIP